MPCAPSETRSNRCFERRADALFELGDAILTAEAAPSPVHLSLEPSHRRGRGSLYAALNRGRIDAAALRGLLARHPLAAATTGATRRAAPSAATITIPRATRPVSQSWRVGPTSGSPR